MKYFVQAKGECESVEVTKERAMRLLQGNWKQEYLDELFSNDDEFDLWTMFSYVRARKAE